MENAMTIAQIEASFPSQWVLVQDPQTSEALQVQGGRVIAHSKDRDEVYRFAATTRPKRFAILYTGTIPKDTAIVL